MKKLLRFLIYPLIGVVAFSFFLYFSFPYKVLKEALATKVSESTRLSFHIGDMRPNLPMGVDFEDVFVGAPGGRSFELSRLHVSVNPLYLLAGKISVLAEIQDSGTGELELSSLFSLVEIITSGGAAISPSHIRVESEGFEFSDMVAFALSLKAKSPDTDVLIKPLLEKVSFTGKLDALVDLNINSNDLSRSNGEATISLNRSALSFAKEMQLPNQAFEVAQIKANFENGVLSLDKSSQIRSADLHLKLEGKVTQKPRIEKSTLDLNVAVELKESLKDQFGFVLDAMAKRDTGGKIDIKVSGALSPQPQVSIL